MSAQGQEETSEESEDSQGKPAFAKKEEPDQKQDRP
jgi:hypothetical protein